MMERIPGDQVRFHPHSFGDPAGRLFRWNDQVFRGISPAAAPFFRRLFRDGVIADLVRRGLMVESEPTDLALDGYELVVRHRAIPICSYPHEWCAAALRDAARVIVELALALDRAGLALKDAHPWNVLIDARGPVYVDLTSIAPGSAAGEWQASGEFLRFCLHPLLLMSSGHDRIARSMLPTPEGISEREVLLLTRPAGLARQPAWLLGHALRAAFACLAPGDRNVPVRRRLERLLSRLEELHIPVAPSRDGAAPRALDSVAAVVERLRPASLLDLGSGDVRMAHLAAHAGAQAVVFDLDHARVTKLYTEAGAKALPILPLLVDFTLPTPGMGLPDHWLIAATERFRCELVLGLGVLEKAFRRRLNLQQFAGGVASFTDRRALVEYAAWEGIPEHYSLPAFAEALSRSFSKVERVSPDPDTRVLFLCEK